MYQKYFKRLMDIVLAGTAVIILSPVLLILAVFVRIKLGSPVLFTQERPGKDCKIFRMYKFRSMTDEQDQNGNLLPDSVRLTAFGKKLRASSLDELPELLNILKGDMSIVGPRPLLIDYLPLYNEEQKKRHQVRPGLSGLAQINGRNAITWEKKFRYDAEYVEKISYWLDVKIIWRTLIIVLTREGINAKDSSTMQRFEGN